MESAVHHGCRLTVMNQERPDEVRARSIVERATTLIFEHADKAGGVDYLSQDGAAALEVTRFTDAQKRRGRVAARSSRDTSSASTELKSCWMLMVPETQPRMKGLVQRVLPSLVQLEEVGESRFSNRHAAGHVRGDGPKSAIYRSLLEAGVERAGALGDRPNPNSGHVHRAILSLGDSGTAAGTDEALRELENELDLRQDNFIKLSFVATKQRHLFVWLDDDTPYAVSRPLRRSAVNGPPQAVELPTRQPRLNPVVSHLWVVNDESGCGWLWNGATWSPVQEGRGSPT